MVEIIIDTMCGDIPNKNITPSKRTFSCFNSKSKNLPRKIIRANYAKLTSFNSIFVQDTSYQTYEKSLPPII